MMINIIYNISNGYHIMCGITGYLGTEKSFNKIIKGLKLLQNRGYDSAGIATLENGKIVINKYANKIEIGIDDLTSLQMLEKHCDDHSANIGIGHTRWATHGAKTDTNSHPHIDYKNRLALVHNGIIENYMEIKNMLKSEGINFYSETDTEVIVNLISYYLDKNNIVDAISLTTNMLQGSWALVIMIIDEPNKLYLSKNGSPLLLGLNESSILIGSEECIFYEYLDSYYSLKDGDNIYVELTNGKTVFGGKDNYIEYKLSYQQADISPRPYDFWYKKEMMEQPNSITRALNRGQRILDDATVKLNGLDVKKEELIDANNIIILGCGTSYYAGTIGCKFFKEFDTMNTVQTFDASEFDLCDIPKMGKTIIIGLSQSGETKDLHKIIVKIKTRAPKIKIVTLVNVEGSLIARESDCGVYLNAGKEYSVASTKSFTSQIVVLALVALWFAQNINPQETLEKRTRFVRDLRKLPLDVDTLLNNSQTECMNIAKKIYKSRSAFILGKNYAECIANEGALKWKEIARIHTEGYALAALKHGPFALIENRIPVILIGIENIDIEKTIITAEEVKLRGARNIIITDSNQIINKNICDHQIKIPHNETFNQILAIIPLQILAYEIALLKNINPDFPRNLAKVVTVE